METLRLLNEPRMERIRRQLRTVIPFQHIRRLLSIIEPPLCHIHGLGHIRRCRFRQQVNVARPDTLHISVADVVQRHFRNTGNRYPFSVQAVSNVSSLDGAQK